MADAQRYEVTATMIVVKVPGAQGGETYLRRGRILPSSVSGREIRRLLSLGLIAEATEQVAVVAVVAAPTPEEQAESARQAEAERVADAERRAEAARQAEVLRQAEAERAAEDEKAEAARLAAAQQKAPATGTPKPAAK